ncbi:D-alanyl-D-alanine carboxypeptidase [Paenibacillus odorifer]|uniref:D-alanyl-D-alanine carboxypeptidase n=1 Tax=Paenibacillus odorifer TaxID=189426 RepID=A0ABX3GFB2_9BACL|nr:serine hydrolase [Paenibacillus odorifer]OMD12896.1 D-alanyl-D-alanine carboxypeptidase [Paenibacillus odorifer]OMD86209.1 D-alanyl-D-alanine carboxypeptidase [Paenibacillus odorifer]
MEKGERSKLKNRKPKLVRISVFTIVLLGVLIGTASKLNLDSQKVLPFFGQNTYASPYIYVYDRESDQAIYEESAGAKVYPASLTKIMTAIVTLEHVDDLSVIAPVDRRTFGELLASNSSMAGFREDEEVTYQDLLYGTLLTSGGEAANTLAVHVAGSVENFVLMMNDKAAEFSLNGTHFTSPEGLHDDNQYTTASDVGKLLDYALANEDFKKMFTQETYLTTSTTDHPEGILLESTVLKYLNEDQQIGFKIIGGKSGTTSAAGQCWATLGLVNNREYIVIVMGAPLKDISHPDQAQIRDTLNLYGKLSQLK